MELEGYLRGLNFRVIYDDIEGEGGFCELKGKPYIILNRRLPNEFKIKIIASALRACVKPTFLPERIREIIDKWGNER